MTWPHPSTHPSTNPPKYPPTHQTIHPPMGGEFFTDFKSLKRIETSWLVQVLLNFNWFWGPPGGWQLGACGWGWVWVCGGMSYACTHTNACTHMHACMHMHVKYAKHGCLHAGGHLQFLYMCVCVCMCVHMHVHVCGDTPHAPRCHQTPTTHLPPPQSRREPKTPNFNNSWTNQDNSILF